MNDSNPLVSVWCMAYNHESYIRQCMDGFVMQKTNFSFEVIIHEDASTDKTADVIREYEKKFPEIIKPIYQTENQYSQKHINMMNTFFIPRAKGKYIAMCEGDDYWTDPLKLQKQVDFLEANPEYGMVHTNFQIVNEWNDLVTKYNRKWKSGYIFDQIIWGKYSICTASVMFKTDLYKKFEKEFDNFIFKIGDLPLWLFFSKNAMVKYFDCKMITYRILRNSASHSTNIEQQYNFHYHASEIRCLFAKKYGSRFNRKNAFTCLYKTMIKETYLKRNYPLSKYYYTKMAHNDFLSITDIKVLLFLLGSKFNFIRNFIKFLYNCN